MSFYSMQEMACFSCNMMQHDFAVDTTGQCSLCQVSVLEQLSTIPFLSRDELQMLLEEHQGGESTENKIMDNIFSLRSKRAFQLMQRLSQVPCVSSRTTVGELRELVKKTKQSFFPVFHRTRQKI